MSRAPRKLRPEEVALWDHVTRSVRPLRRMPEPVSTPAPQPAETPQNLGPAAAASPVSRPREPASPPLVPLERTLKRQVARGRRGFDDAIDLHGLRQAEAHAALLGFLHRAHRGGASLVLVVTGKGAEGGGAFGEGERGVLRRLVPHWLGDPGLRGCVLGFEEAPRARGGAGALLVRIRRARLREP